MNYFAKMAEIRNNKKGGRSMFKWFKKLIKSEEGASAVEYGLIAALIAAVIIAAVTTLGTKIASVFQSIANAIK